MKAAQLTTMMVFLFSQIACSGTKFQTDAINPSDKGKSSSLATPGPEKRSDDDTQIVKAAPPANVMGGYLTCALEETTVSDQFVGCSVQDKAGERYKEEIKDVRVFAIGYDDSDQRLKVTAAVNSRWHFLAKIPLAQYPNVKSLFMVASFEGVESGVPLHGNFKQRMQPIAAEAIVPVKAISVAVQPAVAGSSEVAQFEPTVEPTEEPTVEPEATVEPTSTPTPTPKPVVTPKKPTQLIMTEMNNPMPRIAVGNDSMPVFKDGKQQFAWSAGYTYIGCGSGYAIQQVNFPTAPGTVVNCVAIKMNDEAGQIVGTTPVSSYLNTPYPYNSDQTVICPDNSVLTGTGRNFNYQGTAKGVNTTGVTSQCSALPAGFILDSEYLSSVDSCRAGYVSIGFVWGANGSRLVAKCARVVTVPH